MHYILSIFFVLGLWAMIAGLCKWIVAKFTNRDHYHQIRADMDRHFENTYQQAVRGRGFARGNGYNSAFSNGEWQVVYKQNKPVEKPLELSQ